MLYAWIDDVKRPPLSKRERTVCRDCDGELISVIPKENVCHWRHKRQDCDPWSEPESAWHLGWKNAFYLDCREVALVNEAGERHRADVLFGQGTPHATVLELQHSPISDDERQARESFYRQAHRMFWLVHIHGEQSRLYQAFRASAVLSFLMPTEGKTYAKMKWVGQGVQFIEKWKRSSAHVFFDRGNEIFHLAGERLAWRLGGGFRRSEFALCAVTREEFLRAVRREEWQALS